MLRFVIFFDMSDSGAGAVAGAAAGAAGGNSAAGADATETTGSGMQLDFSKKRQTGASGSARAEELQQYRKDSHKAGVDGDDARARRQNITVNIRKGKRDDQFKATRKTFEATAQAAAGTPVSSPVQQTKKRKAVDRLEDYVTQGNAIEAQDGTSYTVTVAKTQAEKDYEASTKSIDTLLGNCCTTGRKETLYLQMVLLFAQTKEDFKVSYNPASDTFLQTNIGNVVENHFDDENKSNQLHQCTAFLALCMAARKIIGIKSSRTLYDKFKNDVEIYSEVKLSRKVQATAKKQPPYYYLVSDLAARLELDARTKFTCYTTPERTIYGIAAFMAKPETNPENTTELQQMLTILITTQNYKVQQATAVDATLFRNANIGTMMLRLRFH